MVGTRGRGSCDFVDALEHSVPKRIVSWVLGSADHIFKVCCLDVEVLGDFMVESAVLWPV